MGIQVGECLYTLHFAEDQVLIANNEDDIEYIIGKLIEQYSKWAVNK